MNQRRVEKRRTQKPKPLAHGKQYPGAHGKVVDWVEHKFEEGILFSSTQLSGRLRINFAKVRLEGLSSAMTLMPINRKLQIVAGHGRAEAAKVVGMSRIPTIRLDHLSEAQLRAFMIADNQLTDQSTWDEHLLAEQFKIFSDLDLNFSLEVTRFEMGEIDVMVEGFTSASKGGEDARR
jgi:hypothetical protein